MAPAPFDELDEPVAPEAADDALDATLLAFDKAELITLEALEMAEVIVDPAPEVAEEALEASEEALEPAPPPKMVVDPTVVEKVDEPEVSTDTRAEVVIAEEDPPLAVDEEPDPPAPPMPKIVVEPTVVEPMVEPPEVSTDTRAEVVIAEDEAEPVDTVEVTVPVGLVTRVVAVEVVAVADPDPDPDPPVAEAQ